MLRAATGGWSTHAAESLLHHTYATALATAQSSVSHPKSTLTMEPTYDLPPYLVDADGKSFWIINGRRVWREPPPIEVLPDLLDNIGHD